MRLSARLADFNWDVAQTQCGVMAVWEAGWKEAGALGGEGVR